MNVDPETAAERLFGTTSLEMVFFEAVANALDGNAPKVTIAIRLKSVKDHESLEIDIADTGDGIDAEGFERFSKMWNAKDRAHRGQGRFSYLNNFKSTHVHSVSEAEVRDFVFDAGFKGENVTPVPNKGERTGTSLKLSGYKKNRIYAFNYINPTALKEHIILEFYPLLFKCKKDGKAFSFSIELEISEKNLFHDLENKTVHFDVKDLPDLKEFPILEAGELFDDVKLYYHILYPTERTSLVTALNVDGRSFSIDVVHKAIMPPMSEAIFILYSPSFEGKVDNSRTTLQLEPSFKKEIKRLIGPIIDGLLKESIPEIQEKNVALIDNLNEVFPHYVGYFPESTIGVMNKDDTLKAASEAFLIDQRNVLEAGEKLTDKQYDKALELSARSLMEYILYRNKTLTKFDDITKEDTEYDLHDLIIPRRKTYVAGEAESVYTNNAWVIDDKFMTYSKALSEAELEVVLKEISIGPFEDDVSGRPDIALVFSRSPEVGKMVDLVVIELKKREAVLKDQENVISQLKQRARRILKYYDRELQRIWYYGISDISDEMLQVFGEERWQQLYATGELWYREIPMRPIGVTSGTEVPVGFFVLPYDTMLTDARQRNLTFMNLLKNSIRDAVEKGRLGDSED